MSTTVDLGDGMTTFATSAGELVIVDLVGWVKWYTEYVGQGDGRPFAHLDAVIARVQAETGVSLNYTQADAFLHKVIETHQQIKKKQGEELISASSSASTPSL